MDEYLYLLRIKIVEKHILEEIATEIEEKAEQLYDYVMRFIKENYKYSEVKEFLMDDGMDEPTAKAIIAQVLQLRKNNMIIEAKEEMKTGALIAAAGVGIAVLSYIFVHDDVFITLFLHVPLVHGAIMIFKGAIKQGNA